MSNKQILVVDDGSLDKTGEIAQRAARTNKNVRVIRHLTNTGLGTCFMDAIAQAKYTYFCGYPGDGDISAESLANLVLAREKNTVILQYLMNQQDRPFIRRVISIIYTKLLNVLFGLNLRYYNGYCLAEVAALRRLPLLSTGHTIFAEIVIRLVKSGYPYREVPFRHVHRAGAKTHVATLANVYRIATNLTRLFLDIQL